MSSVLLEEEVGNDEFQYPTLLSPNVNEASNIAGCPTANERSELMRATEINVTFLSAENDKLNTRVKRLEKLNRKLRQQKRRLIDKQQSFKINKKHVLDFLANHLSPNLLELVRINISQTKDRGKRYEKKFKRFCIKIYSQSPKAYRLLRSQLKMPAESTLQQMIRKWQCRSGINDQLFGALKQKLEDVRPSRPLYKYCLLCIDEMKISTHVNYNFLNDTVVGISDFRKNGHPQAATHATVILMRGLFENYKQPLAYWFVNSSMKAADLKKPVEECINELFECGFEVKGLVSDMGTNFVKFASDMGVETSRPYFFINNRKIHYFFDTPHLLKATRNCLLKNNIGASSTSHKACWQPIADIYEEDKKHAFRILPKLKDEHISPNNNQKMRVKYAAQILSATMAGALNNFHTYRDVPESYLVTAKFVQLFDGLFDILNSSPSESNAKPEKRAFKGEPAQLAYLNNASSAISKLRIYDDEGIDRTARFTFLKKWPITIAATISLWEDVKNDENVEQIFTRRLNQDPLENFFGLLRNSCGNNRQPTSEQFVGAFKRQLYNPLIEERALVLSQGNCEPDIDDFVCAPNEILATDGMDHDWHDDNEG